MFSFSLLRKERLLMFTALSLFFVIACEPVFGFTYSIRNQRDFDNLKTKIDSVFTRTTDNTFTATIYAGVYYYNDNNNLTWVNKGWSNKTIEINGRTGSTLISETTTLNNNLTWENGSIIYRSSGRRNPQEYDRWSALVKAKDTCRLAASTSLYANFYLEKTGTPLPLYQSDAAYVQFTEWYRSHVYKVLEITNNRILFNYPSSSYSETFGSRNVYFPNFDYYHSHNTLYPRYRLLRNPLKVNNDTVHYCTTESFVNIKNSSLKSFKVSGLKFLCNKRGDDCNLIRFWNNTISSNVLVSNCNFEAIRGEVIYIMLTNNVTVQNCTFLNCYESCVVSLNGSKYTHVKNNTFQGCGKGMRQNFCILCRGENFTVENNDIRQFSYSAIGVGNDRGSNPSYPTKGVVRNNMIDNAGYDEPESAVFLHTLMDAGAIYTWAKSDDVKIIDNTIKNYGGVHTYRGIFCDQGTKNVTIIGNTISNIRDNRLPAPYHKPQNYIEVDWVESSHSNFASHNTNNFVYDNYFDTDTAKLDFEIESNCHAATINVSSSNFSNLSNLINNSINNGNDFIVVNLQQNATYEFKDKHISLSNINRPVSLKIVGHNTTLVPVTSQYTSLDFLSFDSIAAKKPWMQHDFGANHSEVSSNWGNWAFATGLITRTYISRTDHRVTYSIATGNTSLNVSEYDCKGYYIQLTSWYTSQVLPITKIERGVIHFTSLTSEPLSLTNEDYTHSNNQLKPRYRIYHINYSHQYSKASTLLSIEDCTLAKVELSGINVKGNDGKRPLINLDSIKSAGIHISDCNFENIHGTVILAQKTSDLVVSDCTFRDCLGDGISSRNGCIRTKVENNEFYNQGGNMTQSFVIDCRGRNFLVQNNKIENFCFGGIAVGLWRGYDPIDSISGTVRNNNIYFTDSHFGNYQFKTLMGGGAIYAWKQSDRVVITKNTIRNIRGLIGYKAIVGEVGARNLRITDNTINNLRPDWLGVKNYSIDLPWDSSDAAGFNRNNYQSGNVYIYGGASSVIASASGRDYVIVADKLRFEGRAPSSSMSLSPLQESDSEQDSDIHSEQNAPDDDNTTSPYYYNLNGNISNAPKRGFSINVGTSIDRSTNKASLLR